MGDLINDASEPEDVSQIIEKPADYAFGRDHIPDLTPAWPGKLLSFTTILTLRTRGGAPGRW